MEKLNFKLADFEGPLDLLLYLISKHKLNILDISISLLLDQYMSYIDAAKEENLDIKSEFLEMASRLLYIKTLSLLPRHEAEEAELKEKLQVELMERSLCKKAAEELMEREKENETFVRKEEKIKGSFPYSCRQDKNLLREALKISKTRLQKLIPPSKESFSPIIKKKFIPVEGRILYLLSLFHREKSFAFKRIFKGSRDKDEIIATFLALLELIRTKRVRENDEEQLYFINNKAG